MRNEAEVNEARTAFRHYRGSNGSHVVVDEILQPPSTSRWTRFRDRYFKWENLAVAGRTIEKGWVIPQGLGIALIVLMLGGISGLYWRMSEKVVEQNGKLQDQRELLIRMDQRLMDKQSTDEKIEREHRNKDDLQDLQIKDVNDKLLVLNTKKGG